MITYLIIDDEPIAHDIVKGYCDMLPNMKLMKHCYDALEALEYLREHTVHLIFLDLNMPKLKGFEFLKTLSVPPKVIVTTAYQEHALEGYELNIIDYLLKPFSFERFLKAVNKTALPVNEELNPKIDLTEDERIFLYSDKKHYQVQVSDIKYVEAAGNYTKVVLIKSQLIVREKLSNVLNLLSPDMFIQVHKSFIVSKSHIEVIEGNRIIIQGQQIPIGRMYKEKVLSSLDL
ncbi:LytR/AlgR family response regulator transcription factor [Maribacter stanieri]|uniref:LytR/AlgR family response regulator transcription factor n=1 Tax=Maribacter stanieri TaxID=440514 RepID=UPI0024957188|nr:LytTR family DNA-binding domain-containing protein [Maribacter stanieri]|tara:strand:- start:1037 stop:1732 length:696 start_codon:yes stop_codon:yes gene_type:complete